MTLSRETIAIIGAGLMGHGIALVMARAGRSVLVAEPAQEVRASARERIAASLSAIGEDPSRIPDIQGRIKIVDGIAEAVSGAGIVFEAAPEKMELKRAIFAEVETHASPDAILASNTSVMPITQIMIQLKDKSRALGTHWWNPPHMIPLVEVVRTEETSEAAMDVMTDLLTAAGKTPVRVAKDVPGFIGNRMQHALWREAISLVENGICDAEAVDTVVKSCFGRRLAVLGPLENADLIGTDLTLDIHSQVLADLERRPGPSPYLSRMVAEGRLGMKSGEGFRTWTPDQAQAVRDRVARHLARLEGILDD
jgi:3-hydroxybutyryl-CoA dehydrogenase